MCCADMKIIIGSGETVPFDSTGGLGDVCAVCPDESPEKAVSCRLMERTLLARSAGGFPNIDSSVDGMDIDGGKFFVGKRKVIESPDVFLQLFQTAGTDEQGRDLRLSQTPC